MKKNKPKRSPFPRFKNFKIIGLTGGIASGKSTVAKILRRKKIPVIDADKIAHAVIRKNELAYFKIVKTFGKGILKKNGQIDRRSLGQIVFANSQARKKLEAIVHPAVQKKMAEWLRQQHQRKHKLAVLEVPLLFEVGWDKFCDEVWCVYATQKQQIERLQMRNGLTKAEALRRLRAQWPMRMKAKKSSVHIKNTHSIQMVRRQIQKIMKSIV